MGRLSAINRDLIAEVVARVERGVYPETSCCVSGLPVKTMQRWLTRGKAERTRLDDDATAQPLESESLYLEFRNAIDRATAIGEVNDLDLIRLAAESGAWQAAAWRLERRWPERYARKIVIAQETGDGNEQPATWYKLLQAARKGEKQEAIAAKRNPGAKA